MIRRAIQDSLFVRLTAWFAIASTLIITAIGVNFYVALEQGMTERQEELLTNMSALVQKMMEDIPSRERLVEQPDIIGHVLVGHPYLRLWIYGEGGSTLFASSPSSVPMVEWESLQSSAAQGVASKLWRPVRQKAYRLATTRFSSEEAGIGQGFIALALDVSDEVRLLRLLQTSILIATIVSVLAAAAIGLLIVRWGLRPIARLTESAGRITFNQLHERIDRKDVPRELEPLVGSFNSMLERLEDSFRRLTEFSADLAHDLRTPLTSLLGRSQAVLLRKRSADEYREVLEANVETAERMSAIIADMLFLARADYAQSALTREKVNLREEVERMIEYFGIACEERGIKLEAHGHAEASVDRTMLRRALSNLLSNAIRHSPDNECIDVVLAREERTVTVSFIDRGAGVSPEHASRIFDRFYRADPSRARISGGTGLGLAITQSIMRMHGGEVLLKSEPGKSTVFTLVFPTRSDPAPGVPVQDGPPAQQRAASPKGARVSGVKEPPAKMTEI